MTQQDSESNQAADAQATAASSGTSSGTSSGKSETSVRSLVTKQNLSKLGVALLRGAVVVARHGLVPLAETYARAPEAEPDRSAPQPVKGTSGEGAQPAPLRSQELPAEQSPNAEPPPDRLTEREVTALSRAASKLVLETGDLLVANFSPAPGGSTTPPDRSPDAKGFRGEPSLAMAVAAVKGAISVRDAQSKKKADTAREAEIKAQAEELQPVSMNVLRMRNRG